MSSAAYFNQNATMLNSHLKKKKKKDQETLIFLGFHLLISSQKF